MSWPLDFHFQYPNVAYLLFLLIPIFWLINSAHRKRKKVLAKLGLNDKSPLVVARGAKRESALALLLTAGAGLMIIALMGPVGFGRYPSWAGKGAEVNIPPPILFLLDDSLSMGVHDATGGKSRFEEAKEILDTLMDQVNGLPMGLSTFTSHIHQVSPTTYDSFYLRLLLQELSLQSSSDFGTDFLSIFTELRNNRTLRQIVLISDGEDTTLIPLSATARDMRESQILKAVSSLSDAGFTVSTIGVGSTGGGIVPNTYYHNEEVVSKMDPTLLMEIAGEGRGLYFDSKRFSAKELAGELSAELTSIQGINRGELNRPIGAQVQYTPLFQFPLSLALLFFAVSLVIPTAIPKRT